MKKIKFLFMTVSVLLLSVFVVVSAGAPNASDATVEALDPPHYFLYTNQSSISVDGEIGAAEYPQTIPIYSIEGVNFAQLSWAHFNGSLYVGISASVTGWVGLGQGENGMLNAPMVIGSVAGSTATVGDYYGPSTANISPGPDGKNNVTESAGTESSGVTVIEFVIPLNSTDSQDAQWAIGGTYSFFLAAHKTSDQLVYHTYHSQRNLQVTILPESVAAPQDVTITDPAITIDGDLVTFKSTVSANSVPVTGERVEFLVNSSFGMLMLGAVTTDVTGVATLTVNATDITFVGDSVDVIASFSPTQEYSPAMSGVSVWSVNGEDRDAWYEQRIKDQQYDEGSFIDPDFFGNDGRFVGAVMLYVVLTIIFLLVWEYGLAVGRIVRIWQFGKEIDKVEEKKE